MIKAKFSDEQRFCDHYKRNNKAKGRKNLRCFPDCRLTGHVKTGYCGRPATCEVTYDAIAAKNLDLMAFCEFRPHDEESNYGVSLGNTYAFADIITRSRGTGHNPGEKALHPWFPGSVIKSSIDHSLNEVNMHFSFNKGNQGWHYAWQSHRMTRATKHELHIFILAGSKHTSFFTCVCDLSSPAFDIHCRRKRNSPTKAADALLKFQSVQLPAGASMNPGFAGVKRSAAHMSAMPSQPLRSISPKRPMLDPSVIALANQIMPSNGTTTSPLQKFHALGDGLGDGLGDVASSSITAGTAMSINSKFMMPNSKSEFSPGILAKVQNTLTHAAGTSNSINSKLMMPTLGMPNSNSEDPPRSLARHAVNSTESLLLRIQMLEARKQQLQMLQMQMQATINGDPMPMQTQSSHPTSAPPAAPPAGSKSCPKRFAWEFERLPIMHNAPLNELDATEIPPIITNDASFGHDLDPAASATQERTMPITAPVHMSSLAAPGASSSSLSLSMPVTAPVGLPPQRIPIKEEKDALSLLALCC
jgi:hypothetical protein